MTEIARVSPAEAHAALQAQPKAVLLDVRDPIEFAFVGHPLGALNIPWKLAPEMRPNPEFIAQVESAIADKATPIYLICRSGHRSLAAAEALAAVGYSALFNVEDGFEGALNEQRQRSSISGWRYLGLPWSQS